MLQVRRLNMYKKRATRDSKGKIIHQVWTPPRHAIRLLRICRSTMHQGIAGNTLSDAWMKTRTPITHGLSALGLMSFFSAGQDFQSKELPNSRIQPDRRWFGNTRVIGQKQLETFREEMSSKVCLHLMAMCVCCVPCSCKIWTFSFRSGACAYCTILTGVE